MDALAHKIKRKRPSPPPNRQGKGTKVTPLMRRAINLFQEQLYSGQYKSIEDTLLEAGYAPESARQITNVMTSIKPHVEPIVQEMEEHRKQVMERMKHSVGHASYGELVRSLDVTTRNIRLLTGRSTHNFAIDASVRAHLDELLT